MAVIRKIVVNETTVYPRSVTDAIVDTETGEKLSVVIPRMRRIINVVPTDPITTQEIDNMSEKTTDETVTTTLEPN